MCWGRFTAVKFLRDQLGIICMCRGMFPANQLARKHPFILNARIEPLQWAKMAVRGRLPAYAWKDVLNDIKNHTGNNVGAFQATS